ncbi:MAG: precorrin-3B C(17)-methyltransferase, partial [Methanoregulaceae archaeon]|nr:precorrin-3B C(17)-methyltransferase [Methanoregulaceae archaeon]
MTARALKVIARADVVIGNETYLDQLEPLLIGKNVIRSSMGKEVERAKTAIKLAHIHRVAMISGGDAGVYGMAGIVLEVLEHEKIKIPVEIVPGVTAATAAASLVGSPLSGDFAVISLSDLLIP